MDTVNNEIKSLPERKPYFNNKLMRRAMFFWFFEVALSFFNFSVLMNQVYEPHWGGLVAHQIGMSTRIIYVFVIAFFIVKGTRKYSIRDLFFLGLFWMASWLVIEWGGSLMMGRPVSEIVVGWNILQGYMWPYVLVCYLTSALIVGSILRRKDISAPQGI
jgi:hypothetical protein